jgi:ribonuclease HII
MAASPYTPRRSSGLAAYENALARAGLAPVAGIDEAGRGACAGPLVVAAVVLDAAAIKRIRGLADSKLLTPAVRENVYESVVRHALDWNVTTIPHTEIDALGLHVCNIEGMRRAFAGLTSGAAYVLTDGFPVSGLGAPALAMWKGDRVAASVAAASVIAKVTRDRIMTDLHAGYPEYGFSRHKGYSTRSHMKALAEHGPCPEHRRSFANVGNLTAGAPAAVAEPIAQAPASEGAEESMPAGPGSGPEDGHNGPMVDLAGEFAWPAGLAPEARGA